MIYIIYETSSINKNIFNPRTKHIHLRGFEKIFRIFFFRDVSYYNENFQLSLISNFVF